MPGWWTNQFHQSDLNSIFVSRFTLVFVEDNSYPNGVDNHHQYRFEVHSNTSTSTLLASLSDSCIRARCVSNASPDVLVANLNDSARPTRRAECLSPYFVTTNSFIR